MRFLLLFTFLFVMLSCSDKRTDIKNAQSEHAYFNYEGKDDKLSGGVKMININTPSGEFEVWTKRIGNNPDVKVLLLHGGPGATHEYFECFDSYFPSAGIEYYYYDQLESEYSDQPGDTSLWTVERYVDEVEQVRLALGLDSSNFYLLGHSWGGILGIEYALKYGKNLKGLIISNMVPSIPDYVKYAQNVLAPGLPKKALQEIRKMEEEERYTDPRYMELVMTHYYPKHVLRMPLEEWPDPVNRALNKINYDLYLAMQGPSEFGVVGDAKLKYWDRKNDLSKIRVPTLTIGGQYDTMDPEQMKWTAGQVKNGRYLHCPKGSHWSMYDDQEQYFDGLIDFIEDVDQEDFR